MSGTPPKLPSTFEMLMQAAADASNNHVSNLRPWPANPFPQGVREGSATDRVLAELRKSAPQALTHGQLRARCNAGRGAICWAVRYLESIGLIVKVSDTRRHQAYRRYRLKVEAR